MKKALSAVLVLLLLIALVPAAKTFADEKARIVWNSTGCNVNSYKSADALLFTPAWSNPYISNSNGYDYSWWRVIVCDYDTADGCYKVVSVNLSTGSNYAKSAVIPRGGFVIADCYSPSFAALAEVEVGDRAYLYGVDAATGAGNDCTVTFNRPAESGTPCGALNPAIASPETNLNGAELVCGTSGFTVSCNTGEGETAYYAVNDASVTPDGRLTVAPTVIPASGKAALPSSLFTVGSAYTITVWTVSDSGVSPQIRSALYVYADAAVENSLKDYTVVAFGDSLTARTGWVAAMRCYCGADVINSGVGGDTSTAGRARFLTDVLEKDPDVCIINFGMNDQAVKIASGKCNVPIETYIANLEYFITELNKTDCTVILVTPNSVCTASGYYTAGGYGLDYSTDAMDDYCNAVRTLAAEYGCGLVDINAVCRHEDMTRFCALNDGIHQSAYGHSVYASAISGQLYAQLDASKRETITVKYLCGSEEICEQVPFAGENGAAVDLYRSVDGYILTTTDTEFVFGEDTAVVLRYSKIIEGILGDVNGNGEIDAGDYLMAKRIFLGTFEASGEQADRGDIDRNGRIDASDYLKIKRHFLGTYVIE